MIIVICLANFALFFGLSYLAGLPLPWCIGIGVLVAFISLISLAAVTVGGKSDLK